MLSDEGLLDGFVVCNAGWVPQLSISSESGILHRWVFWIVVVFNLSVIVPVSVGKRVVVSVSLAYSSDFDHFFFHLVAHLQEGLVLKVIMRSSLVEGPESSIGTESGILDGWVDWIVVVNVFLIVGFVSIGNLIRVFLAVALVLLFVMMSLLSKSPESSISSESSILNGWVDWIIIIDVLLIVRLVTVSNLIRVLFAVAMASALVLHLMVMFFLSKSPESSVSSESSILNGWINWIIIVNVFLIVRFVSIGNLIRVFLAVALVLFLVLMSLLSKSPESGIGSESGILDRWINWIIIIDVLLII